MNATTRYILTATAVGAGLFTVGATANALASGSDPDPAPIGDPVVVPSATVAADPVPDDPEEVDLPEALDLDDTPATSDPVAVIDTGGWATGPAGSGLGDDDDSDDDESDDPDEPDDDDEPDDHDEPDDD